MLRRYVDYKVGDWVETCSVMPAIVQEINEKLGSVYVFYPHYKEKYPDYTGWSCCSIYHCGVHKIDEKLAKAMLAVGEERVTRLWHFLKRNCKIHSIECKLTLFKKKVADLGGMEEGERKAKLASKYQGMADKYAEKLGEAWKLHEELFNKTIFDLCGNVPNNITKGIWLSYKMRTVKRLKKGLRLVRMETGEEMLLHRSKRKGEHVKYDLIEKIA